jgi:hypothetical protein
MQLFYVFKLLFSTFDEIVKVENPLSLDGRGLG